MRRGDFVIISDYSTFRMLANPGGSFASDGLPEFDPSKMRANGFDDGIEVAAVSFPLAISCNGGIPDTSFDVDEYDWYVSQRTNVEENRPFVVSRSDTFDTSYSGTILLEQSVWCADEYPDPFDLESSVQTLFFGVDIYVIRRSDGAIQRLDLLKYLIDALSPKTDLG